MTREETIKVLAILKAAYPNSYRNMTKEEANGTVAVWAMQFADVPADIVLIAVNKLISTSPFPPAICEVKKKIGGMYWEAWHMLDENKNRKTLTGEQEALYQKIFTVAEKLRNQSSYEPTLAELTQGKNSMFLLGSPDQ